MGTITLRKIFNIYKAGKRTINDWEDNLVHLSVLNSPTGEILAEEPSEKFEDYGDVYKRLLEFMDVDLDS